ncbi:MAG: MFS transporter [Polyangiaceae bacterium]|nr:MFS transporter [Polyangiaceae bacterium]
MGPLAPIFLTVLVDVLALTIVLPLLPFYAQDLGASKTVVGLLFASFSLCQLFSGPVLGRLSDKLGRKPVLVVSQLGTCAGLVIMAFAQRVEWLFVGRMLDGLTAGNLSIAQAYIADVTKPEKRTRAFALIGIAFGLGFLIGPAFAGVFAKHFGNHAPFLLAAGLSLTSVGLTVALLPRTPPMASAADRGLAAARRVLSQPKPRLRLLEFFSFLVSFSMLTGGLALFLQDRLHFDVEHVGWTFAFAGLVGGLMQGGIGRLASSLGEERLSAVGAVFMAAGYAVLSQTGSVLMLGIALALGSIGSAVVRPALTTLLTGSVGDEDRGLVLGAQQSLASIATAAGPAVSGLLIQRGLHGVWALGMATMALGLLVVRWLLGSRNV